MRFLMVLPVMIGFVLLLLIAAAVATARMIFQLLLGTGAQPLIQDEADQADEAAESGAAASARGTAQANRQGRRADSTVEMMRSIRN